MSASDTSAMKGSCLCGSVKLSATAAKRHIGACHCNMCRTWGGGPLLAFSAGTTLEIEGQDHIARYASSDWAERGFCKNCGTHLFYFLKHAGTYTCPAGLFPETADFDFTNEIFVDEKPANYAFAGERTRMTGAELMAAIAPKD